MSVSATPAPASRPHPLDVNWTRGTFKLIYSQIVSSESTWATKVCAVFAAFIMALAVLPFEAEVYIPRAIYRMVVNCCSDDRISDAARPLRTSL